MELRVLLPDDEAPATISEVVAALKKEDFTAKHDKQSWGDWITLGRHQTVIAIESQRGLTTSAVIEFGEGEEDELQGRLCSAFRSLGWEGEDEDGRFTL
ncbi:MAG: hypothetical protein Q7Q71_02395 [Verrucomicrobiota bacterium JB023]|nr:hypothetical protein [Verrucomicrobiota bacterium JB023]